MTTHYIITVKGHLDQHWSAWFDGLLISQGARDETVFSGPLVDQAALHGVLVKIRDLGLPLIAVASVSNEADPDLNGDSQTPEDAPPPQDV